MARILLIACGIAAAAGCGYKERAAEQLQPNRMYEKAHGLLLGGDYRGAVRYYEALEARYPFSQEARQSRLDLIYAYYRAGQQESAVDAADQFVRENPTHPRVDYAMYLRGLIYFERSPNFLERWFNTDLTERPPQDVKRAFDAFEQLIRSRPDSIYSHDARQRMIFLRNRLVRQALEIMIASYRGLGLDDLAERSQEVFALNYPDATLEKHEKKWWRFD